MSRPRRRFNLPPVALVLGLLGLSYWVLLHGVLLDLVLTPHPAKDPLQGAWSVVFEQRLEVTALVLVGVLILGCLARLNLARLALCGVLWTLVAGDSLVLVSAAASVSDVLAAAPWIAYVATPSLGLLGLLCAPSSAIYTQHRGWVAAREWVEFGDGR